MKYQYVVILASATVFMLGGCGSSSIPSSSTEPSSPAEPSSGDKVFSADPNGNAVSILDAAELGADINGIFGGENAEPVPVNPGDTIGDVLDRAKSS